MERGESRSTNDDSPKSPAPNEETHEQEDEHIVQGVSESKTETPSSKSLPDESSKNEEDDEFTRKIRIGKKKKRSYRKECEAANEAILAKWKEFLQQLVLPTLDDESLIRFKFTCTGGSKIVNPLIHSRGISLSKLKPGADPVEINLVSDGRRFGSSPCTITVSSKGSLASAFLCAERARKIQKYGKDCSFDEYVEEIDPPILKILGSYFEAASSDDDGTAIETWAIKQIDDAREQKLLEIIWAAERLKMERLILRASVHMAQHLKGKTSTQMRKILGFLEPEDKDEPATAFDDYMFNDSPEYSQEDHIKDMRRFFELMIPRLDDQTYLRFAGTYKVCAILLNDVQSRKCFLPGRVYDPWKIYLVCSDGKTIMAENQVIKLSGLIKNHQIERQPYEDDTLKITLKSTTAQVLRRITSYCDKHTKYNISHANLKTWDDNFLKKDDVNALLDLGQAAREMKVSYLVDLISQTIAAKIKNKTVPEMRAMFDLKDVFRGHYTESEWRIKHGWADPLPERFFYPAHVLTDIPAADLSSFIEKHGWLNRESRISLGPEPEQPHSAFNDDSDELSLNSLWDSSEEEEEETDDYEVEGGVRRSSDLSDG